MTFDFFNVTGTTSGDFDHILVSADGYTARFNALDGSLTFAAVPEPSTYATIAGHSSSASLSHAEACAQLTALSNCVALAPVRTIQDGALTGAVFFVSQIPAQKECASPR